ncbi:hypothetical protein [Parahaliea mediterranea]|uniref:hypothetical protein n=1 Tax=Parahaliea mediterranea TaxID=651086 RepID=UPI00130038C9|nr:hypothetical protein [Parahaliea mediterranea]
MKEIRNNLMELHPSECEAVSGGIVPIVFAAISMASTTTARTMTWALLSRVSAMYGVFDAAHYMGGGGSSGSKKTGNISDQ